MSPHRTMAKDAAPKAGSEFPICNDCISSFKIKQRTFKQTIALIPHVPRTHLTSPDAEAVKGGVAKTAEKASKSAPAAIVRRIKVLRWDLIAMSSHISSHTAIERCPLFRDAVLG